MPYAINSVLDTKDIVATNAIYVKDTFHPQINIYKKMYKYAIYNNEFINPINKNYAHFVKNPLDIEKMQQSCKYFLGTHDFSTFCATGGNSKTKIRTIYSLDIQKRDDMIYIYVSGDGFLYNMVRIIAGTLIKVGHSKISPQDIEKIIKSRDRKMAGETAKACGLTLYKIWYNM